MNAYMGLARWYDDLTGDVPYEVFADYYERKFEERGKSVDTLLDFACGTGTLTCIMAERGYEMIAVDASSEMLMELMDKAYELEDAEPPLMLCQDAVSLDLNDVVDAAYCSLDGINYIVSEDLTELFRLLHLFIDPDGLFVFDINSPERFRSLDGQVFVDETEDVLCLWRADFDEGENALVYGMDLFTRTEDDLWERECEEHVEYAHEVEWLVKELTKAGFVNIEVDVEGPQSDKGRVFITAENTPH
ncbi:MAG: class I SAM-dependent methyltransferase [Oscillospiraceae bacterium]|nr:class I SAM-dependent methyltransferase [Oscillospiraceae bacterium]